MQWTKVINWFNQNPFVNLKMKVYNYLIKVAQDVEELYFMLKQL